MRVGTDLARKPALAVDEETPLVVERVGPRWVGRGAEKLLAALDAWAPEGLSVQARRCLDVGASTGGFTQVLLRAGAAHVVALDVGHGQLVPELAQDPRVEDRSGTSVRGLTAADLGGPFDVVVVDLSFISLTLVASELADLLGAGGDLVLLVKPQFEVGRARLGGQGVVTDPGHRADALDGVLRAVRDRGLGMRGLLPSPLPGSTGNIEYLMWVRHLASDTMTEEQSAAAVRAATGRSGGGR